MHEAASRYFLVNKPRNMVSQFISSHDVPLLGGLDFDFPAGTHAIGRLDRDSEGLLILTTDKTVTRKIFLRREPHLRRYLVLVQNEISAARVAAARAGISIEIKNGETYIAVPAGFEKISNPRALCAFAADPREAFSHSWLLVTLTEGKFRQVRKMMLALNHRCLRLIRLSIGQLSLGGLPPGGVREITAEELFSRIS